MVQRCRYDWHQLIRCYASTADRCLCVRVVYPFAGVSIVITIILNSLGPQLSPLFKWLVIAPAQRWWGSKRAVMQEELNSLYEGHTFNIAIRVPTTLNTLFVSFAYW